MCFSGLRLLAPPRGNITPYYKADNPYIGGRLIMQCLHLRYRCQQVSTTIGEERCSKIADLEAPRSTESIGHY